MADFRETLYTVDKAGNRKWLYPSVVHGRFRRYRRIVVLALLAFYLIMPWVRINGEQGILINFTDGKFNFFGQSFFATDSIYLFLVLATLALSLFFFTTLFGRIWCGWACPETVFLEFLFRPIERWIEGNHIQRKRLDEAPWSVDKVRKKLLKHAISATLAWILASTFLAYFVGQERLIQMMSAPPWENWPTFIFTVVLMGLFAFQFGWFREQFCSVLCPYARFQSVLLDPQSIVIGYDSERGEPRGKKKKGDVDASKGDCIDCKKCIHVCPTGIDIRNGLQLECINCAACIDACDEVMEKIERPKGLIRYASQTDFTHQEKKIFRPRVALYGTIILILVTSITFLLSTRARSDFQVLRGALDKPFSIDQTGTITNHLHLKIMNKSRLDEKYQIELISDKLELVTPVNPVSVSAESATTTPIFIRFAEGVLVNGRHKVTVKLNTKSGFTKEQEITVLGPGK